MFVVPKQIDKKMVTKGNYVLQTIFINSQKPQLGPTKKFEDKNRENCNIFASKTPTNDLSTLNYGRPSSFTNLSTWETIKRG